MIEEWKDIKGYEGLYQVSNLGRVFGIKRQRFLNIVYDRNGYSKVKLTKNGIGKLLSVHRIVAINFIDNEYNKEEVNHIDEDKTNNMVSNLEWCTRKENVNHGTRTERMIKTLNKKIVCSNGNEYNSIKEACQDLNCHSSSVVNVLKGNLKQTKGYTFKYKEVN